MESNVNDQTWSLTTSEVSFNSETKVHLFVNDTDVQVYYNGSLVGSATTTSTITSTKQTQLYLGYGATSAGISIGGLFTANFDAIKGISFYLSASTRYTGSSINTVGFSSFVADKFMSDNRAITPVTFMSEKQLIAFLNFNLGLNNNLHKRQSVSQSSSSLTSYYLSLCPLNSISTNATGNNQILAGCLAGVTQTCQTGDSTTCRTYWGSVYENSVYKPIQPCLPWNSGATSAACNTTIISYCNTLGIPAYQCKFAKTSQSVIFTNPNYVPCSKDVAPFSCVY